jgi:hypothetical protein
MSLKLGYFCTRFEQVNNLLLSVNEILMYEICNANIAGEKFEKTSGH